LPKHQGTDKAGTTNAMMGDNYFYCAGNCHVGLSHGFAQRLAIARSRSSTLHRCCSGAETLRTSLSSKVSTCQNC
jgi:hypothetical protein